MEIRQATMADFDGIRALIKANHVNYIAEEDKVNGFVTTTMTDQQLEALIVQEDGVTIAVEDGKVCAFAFADGWEYWKEWPMYTHMIGLLDQFSFEGQILTSENTYLYGPVCVDKAVRGSGLFEKIFFTSLARMKGRYPIMVTFINQINPRSYAAHTRKTGMTEVGTFQFNNNNYYLMACSTKPAH